MKKLFLIILLISAQVQSFAQSKASQPIAEKFIHYYNTDQADSLYSLFSDEMRNAVPFNNFPLLMEQLKAQIGNLLTSEYIGPVKELDKYIIALDKSEQVLGLVIDKNNKVVGFHIEADTRVKSSVGAPGSVTIETPTAILKGTLSVPDVSAKVPVVVFIAGSGPTDRDGNTPMAGIKTNTYLKISDELKAKNIAVLRYDKRAIGKSTSLKSESDLRFEDMVDDAVFIIDFLKKDSRFSKIIVAGHSEGSLVGMLACQRTNVDGFISLAGPGFAIDEILKTQLKPSLSADDFKKASSLIDSIKAGKLVKQLQPGFDALFRESIQPYLFSLMKYNPSKELSKLIIPVLLVQGTTDIQVSVADAKQLKKVQPKARLNLIKGMNHILKEAPAKLEENRATYLKPELGLHPELIPVLMKFVKGI